MFEENGEEQVLVTINGTAYTVSEGEEFAEFFRVLDIDGNCATLAFGDSSFVRCEGESIRK